uniref:Uncharacterized protein n=1 Tax=viral metagenome TaxID=1070528 RepID=A0A6C0ISJ5_9ZZZZ
MSCENVIPSITIIDSDNHCGKCVDKFLPLSSSSEAEYTANEILSRQIANQADDTTNNVKKVVQIFRFKFTPEFMDELFEFSKIHQYDERKDFKEAWLEWVEDNKEIVECEIDRLNDLGYDGDIVDKMFKSARYYFRKKSVEKKEPKARRQYIGVSKDLLDAMDTHIEENIADSSYQPKNGFIAFCKDNEILVKEVITNMIEKGIHESSEIQDKIKKTYKNRYFKFTTN